MSAIINATNASEQVFDYKIYTIFISSIKKFQFLFQTIVFFNDLI